MYIAQMPCIPEGFLNDGERRARSRRFESQREDSAVLVASAAGDELRECAYLCGDECSPHTLIEPPDVSVIWLCQ